MSHGHVACVAVFSPDFSDEGDAALRSPASSALLSELERDRCESCVFMVATERKHLERFIQKANIGKLFDLVEFFVRRQGCSDELKREHADAFVTARAGYPATLVEEPES